MHYIIIGARVLQQAVSRRVRMCAVCLRQCLSVSINFFSKQQEYFIMAFDNGFLLYIEFCFQNDIFENDIIFLKCLICERAIIDFPLSTFSNDVILQLFRINKRIK